MAVALSTETVHKIEVILQTLDNQGGKQKENRRGAKRLKLRMSLRATVFVHNNTPTVRVFTRNISTSGIGLVSRRAFRKGEHFVVEIALPERPMKMILARTTFCRYLAGGLYELGAQFVEAIVPAQGQGQIPPQWYELAGVGLLGNICIPDVNND